MSIEKNFTLESIGASSIRKSIRDKYYFYKKCLFEPSFCLKTKNLFDRVGIDPVLSGGMELDIWNQVKNKVVHSVSTIQPTFIRDSICVQMYDDTDKDLLWAYQNGAFLLITDHKVKGLPCFVTENPPLVYAKLCRYYRELRNISVTAVTGSIGKTTLKRMIQSVYETELKTFCNVVNHNALYHAGYFCQHIPRNYDVMVQEVSEDTPLYTKPMSVVLKPRIVAITNITVSHIEAFGSYENIVNEVLSITDGMDPDGYVIVNIDDFRWLELLKAKKVIKVSNQDTSADYYSRSIKIAADGLHFDVFCKKEQKCFSVHLKNIFGLHNVSLALQAFAAGRLENLPLTSIVKGLNEFKMTGMRQNYFKSFNGIHVYADCFNAVSKSVGSALNAVSNIPIEGKKVAVLGDVGELGDFSESEHKEIARLLNQTECITDAIIYGDKLSNACRATKFRKNLKLYFCANHSEIILNLDNLLAIGDLVLFKGSHSCNLRDVINKMWPREYSQINHEERDPYVKWISMVNKN